MGACMYISTAAAFNSPACWWCVGFQAEECYVAISNTLWALPIYLPGVNELTQWKYRGEW